MIIDELFEAPQRCPECVGISFSNLILAEKKDACYHKVKASAKVWPSAYASGRLVQCRKKGAANYGNKSEGIEEQGAALTKKVLGKVGRTIMPTLGFTDAADRLSNNDYTGAGISAAAGTVGLIPAWPAQLASGGLELINMTRDEANALGGYDKLAKEISKNFTIPEYDPSYLPENPEQSEGVFSTGKALYNRGKDFVKYLRRDVPLSEPPRVTGGTLDQGTTTIGGVKRPPGTVSYSNQPGTARTVQQQDLLPDETLDQAMRRIANQSGSGEASIARPNANTTTVRQTPNPDYVPPKTLLQKYDELNNKLDQLPPAPPVKIERPGRAAADQRRTDQAQAAELKDVVPLSPAERDRLRPVDANKVRQSELNKEPPDLGNVRPGLDEESRKKRKEPEVDYDAIDHDKSVARLRHLAGIGSMKTVWDPARRVYKNVPTAQQPKVQPKK